MPSLSERLQALGVTVGAKNLPPSKPKQRLENPIENVIPGEWWSTPHGDIFTVETKYRKDFRVGNVGLVPSSSYEVIAAWAGESSLVNLNPEKFAFIDTETTGLSSGTGTLAFLIGIGRFEGDEFKLAQFFLHDPAEEPAQLTAMERFISPCEAIVSFNGKSFDLPIIQTRFISNGWPPPLENIPHLDLLHLARRLWKSRLPNRALGELEYQILGAKRSENDVPSWMISQLYFDYLHTGDARPLRGVFYHNEIDIVSLAALLSHMSKIIAEPINTPIEHGLDIIAIGKLYADLGYWDKAVNIYEYGLERDDIGEEAYWSGLKQLSFINKRRGDFDASIKLWEQAAINGYIFAHIELAKYYEHQNKDYKTALNWTDGALGILANKSSPLEQADWQEELLHRKKRLERKIINTSNISP